MTGRSGTDPVPETTDRSHLRVDERTLVAGTSLRFVMLVVLLLTLSASMMLPVVSQFRTTKPDYVGCELAAGVDPRHAGEASSYAQEMAQEVPFAACQSKYAPGLPLWALAAWPVGLVVVAGGVFAVLPVLMRRRRYIVPLPPPDEEGHPQALLEELALAAGLNGPPTVVLDMAAKSRGAEVFGTDRRPVVSVPNGLLDAEDQDGARAVLLHEFAHIKNRDITLTYATVALWRVFVAVILLPYAVWEGEQIYRNTHLWHWPPTVTPGLARAVLLPLVTLALVYLARSDVLRTRELYADLAAVRHGATARKWEVGQPPPEGSRAQAAWASFTELWRSHPRLELRRHNLDDPAPVFGVQALPTFLVGVVAILLSVDLLTYLSPFIYHMSMWLEQAVALVPALVVTGVVGVALWRSVAFAASTERPAPSGIRVGFWLGLGMAAGDLLTGNSSGNGAQWWPTRPAALLLTIGAGVAVMWWTAQCARLAARTWRGRGLLVPMTIGLSATCLILLVWFSWWALIGVGLANGYSPSIAGVEAGLRALFSASGLEHSATLTAAAEAFSWLNFLFLTPLVPVAVALVWTVPAAAWAAGPTDGVPRWMARVRTGPDDGRPRTLTLPPLRRVLVPGFSGGAIGTVMVIGVEAYLHHWQSRPPHSGHFALTQVVWILLALVASALGAAVAAFASAGRFRLLATLIAAETAALTGILGMSLVVTTDGCLPVLNTLGRGCTWQPPWDRWHHQIFPFLLSSVVVTTAILSFVVAGAGSVVLRLRRRGDDHPAPAGSSPPLAPPRRPGRLRFGLYGVAATAVAIVVGQMAFLERTYVMTTTPSGVQTATRGFVHVPTTPVDASLLASQVHAWGRLGGLWIVNHATTGSDQLISQINAAAASKKTAWRDMGPIGTTCDQLGLLAPWANGNYFRVPDAQAGLSWTRFGTNAAQGSRDCRQGLNQKNARLFGQGLRELAQAGKDLKAAKTRMATVLRTGGYQVPPDLGK
ncbi:M56 family metallopeptidase [Streptomyces sp. NPDC006660]|uniref:M56 family metallopeptidase n=1 Tax=Streptomyces sp. NPDC006660 TaxID=3156901 RepID=UPI00340B54CE